MPDAPALARSARALGGKALRAAVAFCGPVATAVKDGLNDAEKAKVLVKVVTTYGLTWAGLHEAAEQTDLLLQWLVPLAPAVFTGAWEAAHRFAEGAEQEAKAIERAVETTVVAAAAPLLDPAAPPGSGPPPS